MLQRCMELPSIDATTINMERLVDRILVAYCNLEKVRRRLFSDFVFLHV